MIETPSFIRHLVPFAATSTRRADDTNAQGTYIVTPPETPEMMREHNYASISNTRSTRRTPAITTSSRP